MTASLIAISGTRAGTFYLNPRRLWLPWSATACGLRVTVVFSAAKYMCVLTIPGSPHLRYCTRERLGGGDGGDSHSEASSLGRPWASHVASLSLSSLHQVSVF